MEQITAVESVTGRTSRWIGRQALRSVTTDQRCADCGREPLGSAVGIRRTIGGGVGYAGLASCGRIWQCPVCQAKIMAQRTLEIAAALVWAEAHGLHVLFGALTVRHHAFSDLGQLLELQRRAWRVVVRTRVWVDDSATSTVPGPCGEKCEPGCTVRHRLPVDLGIDGRVGFIRASEITIGPNGWHPHFHPIIFYRGSIKGANRAAAALVSAWVKAVREEGGEAIEDGGQMIKRVTIDSAFVEISKYVTKQTYGSVKRPQTPKSLALEATWSQGKRSRGRAESTVPHWAILEEVAAGDYTRIHRWDELEDAVFRHRMITWSRGLRLWAGVGEEVEDETIAKREVGSKEDTVCYITLEGWRVVRDQPEKLAGYLDVLEGTGGWSALQGLLAVDGVEFFVLESAGSVA